MLEDDTNINETLDKQALIDIQIVNIDPALVPKERLENYLSKVKNPYNFKCDDVEILINYKDTDKTLRELLTKHFIQQKQ